ncbi:MAG TPA: hypothetical protein VHJ58_08710 [Vicinamibacterales bacterium]|nr:hypothetical protein [Vicinamibacterales bacterium]
MRLRVAQFLANLWQTRCYFLASHRKTVRGRAERLLDEQPQFTLARVPPNRFCGCRLPILAQRPSWSTDIHWIRRDHHGGRAWILAAGPLHESVNDEWSFVQTLRHLVFAMDKWFTAPILGAGFHPIGLPNSGSVDFPWPGLDDNLRPSVSEALAVRADRATRFRG